MDVAPLGPVAGAYYLDNSRIAVIEGPVGSGKSTASCLRLQRHAYQQAPSPDGIGHTRWAIVRNTKPQLKDTTIETWLQVFPERVYGRFFTGDDLHTVWEFRPKGHAWPIRAEFLFRALDDAADVANLLSLEVTGFWFNECREIVHEILAHAGRRLRYRNGERAATWSGWIGDTNPWDTEHHLEEMLAEPLKAGYAHFRQPGGMDAEAENLDNLEQTPETILLPRGDKRRREQGRQYYVKALQDYKAEDARVYVHAQRGITRAGKPIYSSYNDLIHCKPFELDRRLPLQIGVDFGRTPAAVIGQRDARGRHRIRKELVTTNTGITPFAEELVRILAADFPGFEIESCTGDPAGVAQDTSDKTAFQLMAAGGMVCKPAHTNEWSVRETIVNKNFETLVDGDPALMVHPDCKITRRACIDGYHYRKLQVAGDRYDDKPNKNPYSHPAEALQYYLLGTGEGRKAVKPKGARRRPLQVIGEDSVLD